MTAGIDLGIDHLVDVEVIGRGGFSVVYSATHSLLDRRMAVKVLNRFTKESERRRFERECEIMGRLSDHPNVVSVLNAGYAANGSPYLLMELVEGGSLEGEVARHGQLPWRDAVAYLIPICSALERAHRDNILHRDIKPENILLDGDKPLLADFGIASLRDATGATSTHITASMAHTAPETFENKRDERSDLYSVASTLYALIVGRSPFWRPGDSSIHPLMNRLLNEAAPRIPAQLAPQPLIELVGRTLAKDPAARPQSAAELRRALEALLSPGKAEPSAEEVGQTGVAAPPGWYEAPGDPPGTLRYWSGQRWEGEPQQRWWDPEGEVGGAGLAPVPRSPSQLASPARRILARSIDFLAWGTLWLVVIWPFYGPDTPVRSDSEEYAVLVVTCLFTTVLIVAYEVVFVALWQATPGKALLGLRVARADDGTVGLGVALKRQVLDIVLGVLTALIFVPFLVAVVVGIVGLVMVLSNERRQAPWDRLAGTIVVRR